MEVVYKNEHSIQSVIRSLEMRLHSNGFSVISEFSIYKGAYGIDIPNDLNHLNKNEMFIIKVEIRKNNVESSKEFLIV